MNEKRSSAELLLLVGWKVPASFDTIAGANCPVAGDRGTEFNEGVGNSRLPLRLGFELLPFLTN